MVSTDGGQWVMGRRGQAAPHTQQTGLSSPSDQAVPAPGQCTLVSCPDSWGFLSPAPSEKSAAFSSALGGGVALRTRLVGASAVSSLLSLPELQSPSGHPGVCSPFPLSAVPSTVSFLTIQFAWPLPTRNLVSSCCV